MGFLCSPTRAISGGEGIVVALFRDLHANPNYCSQLIAQESRGLVLLFELVANITGSVVFQLQQRWANLVFPYLPGFIYHHPMLAHGHQFH